MKALTELSEKLQKINFRRIAIVDDMPTNIEAAKKAAEGLPDISFIFSQSAAEIIQLISNAPDCIDLIITDLRMEDDEAGLAVVEEGFNRNIFVVVASGGYAHHDMPQVRIAPDTGANIDGDKDSAGTWITILEAIAIAASNDDSILSAFLRARKAGLDFQSLKNDSFPLGEHVRMVVGGYFRYVCR